MTDLAALEPLLRRVVREEVVRLRDEVAELQRALERLAPPPLSDEQQRLLDVLADVTDGPFTSAEVIKLSRSALSTRQPLRNALAALGIDDAQRLGLVLGDIVKKSVTLDRRLVRLKTEGNSRVWMVEGT